MNNNATKGRRERFWIWLIWRLVISAALSTGANLQRGASELLLGVAVESEQEKLPMFPWQRVWRVKKWAYANYKRWRTHYCKANRTRQLAQVALAGMIPLAQVVDALTAKQMRYRLGALPGLYALLETLAVREIINRHCPTKAGVAHGTVVLVLVLNRLLLPLPLSQIADWVGQTVLIAVSVSPPASSTMIG